MDRRDFVKNTAAVAAGAAIAAAGIGAPAEQSPAADTSKILNHNSDMEYRKLGKTNLMISAVCLGGHWKRIDKVLPPGAGDGAGQNDFDKNRYDVVSQCMERGINYIDACTGEEVTAYSKALKGRRDKMYLGYSWYEKEARFPDWRSADKLLASFDAGLKEAQLDYVDLWRITCHEQGGNHTYNETQGVIEALAKAKQDGKARFTGVSSHDRRWLKWLLEEYPDQIDVIVTPYTANTKELPKESLFDAVRAANVGVFGIKPFASGSLFKGDSSPASPEADEDNKRARLAIRFILLNPSITAPIPGLITRDQVDNMAKAVKERRELDMKEQAELDAACEHMWANLPSGYGWLRNWEYV
jgi:aryl-alcohol dehydrogenase-like predicted oxidoreductase